MANILFISYDNGSHIPFFPQNIFYLYGALRKQKKHRIGTWFQDIHHGPSDELTRILDDSQFDMVCLGFVAGYWQYRKAKEISNAVNASKNRTSFKYILGGHGPAAEPEHFLSVCGADAVVVGDGEDALVQIAEDPAKGKGVVDGGSCSADAPVGCYPDFAMDIYRLIRWPTSVNTDFCWPVLSSRGCRWHCTFCYRMRKGFEERSVESIMDEVKYLHNQYQINHIQFSDELLMSSEKRTEAICTAILESGLKLKWDCNGRLNFAKPDLLKLMKESGCEYVNYGIESLDQTLLNDMNKGLTLDQIHQGVEATLAAGLSPGLNLIWGFPGDTRKNLGYAVSFLKQYDPCHELRTIRPVTPYPGTALYRLAIERGLLEGPEDFYERKHMNSDMVSVNFTDIPTEDMHKALFLANSALVMNYMEKRRNAQVAAAKRMYLEGYTNFRGFRNV